MKYENPADLKFTRLVKGSVSILIYSLLVPKSAAEGRTLPMGVFR